MGAIAVSNNALVGIFLVGCLVSWMACGPIARLLIKLMGGKWYIPAFLGAFLGVLSFFLMGQSMLSHSEIGSWFWCLMMLTGAQIFGQCFKARDQVAGNDYWN